MEVDIRYRCDELLDSIGNEEIARYCYENNMMTKEQALEVVGDENALKKHYTHCYILVDPEDVLYDLDNDEIYEHLLDQGYNFPKEKDDDDDLVLIDFPTKQSWLNTIKNQFSKMFTKVYTKEDLKKELCDAIDFYLY